MMEKHKCKLCFRSFSNGRALGGHMRSHMLNLPIPPKPHQLVLVEHNKLAEEADSASSQSEQHYRRFNVEEEEVSDEKSLFYGLRENPKRSVKLVDPEFSMMILQDRESETESSKNPTRRRSKRARRPDWSTEPDPEPEPASSISDATTEEDVAFCLMMMSRDNWIKNRMNKKRRSDDDEDEEEFESYEDDDEEEESEFEEKRQESCQKGKYKCETCEKVFKSYQALGGHRASHKKLKLSNNQSESERNNGNAVSPEKTTKSHQCPICLRVFSSGQALGGHKRSHVIAADSSTPAKQKPKPIVVISAPRSDYNNNNIKKFGGENLIDLNLPAPDYDDDETSQVSDAEFVNRAIIRQ